MELEIGQLRAFVAVVDRGHFGRAAADLYLTQQALSHRIRRLEQTVGVRLLTRDGRTVELTDAGRRLLPLARQTLASAAAAAAAAQDRVEPLRIDVWGQVHAPLRLVRRVVDDAPDVQVRISTQRSFVNSIAAVAAGDLDVAFGRVEQAMPGWPANISSEPVILARLAAAVNAAHPWAAAAELPLSELTRQGLWWPADSGPPEMARFVRLLGEAHDIPLDLTGTNLGVEAVVEHVRSNPAHIAVIGPDWVRAPIDGVTVVPLRPEPCFLWSAAWRADDDDPALTQFLTLLRKASRSTNALDFDPSQQWLPAWDIDLLLSRG